MATAIQMFEALTQLAQALKDNATAGLVLAIEIDSPHPPKEKRFPATARGPSGSIGPSRHLPKDSRMSVASQLLNTLPATIKTLQESPLAAVVLITLGAFALVGYALYKLV